MWQLRSTELLLEPHSDMVIPERHLYVCEEGAPGSTKFARLQT